MPSTPKLFHPKMPSPPKLFHARQPSYSRRLTVLILCFLIGISGFIFGFIAISRQGLGYRCKYAKPNSVSVTWDRLASSIDSGNGGQNRHKVMGFVGIQTGFGSAGRRRSLRKSWFPSDHQGFQR